MSIALLSCTLALLTPPSPLKSEALTRRAALLQTSAAAAALSIAPLPALAGSDGAWAKHTGPFEDDFFADFTVSKVGKEFVYKFVEEGTGDKAVNYQQLTMHYAGYLLDGTKFDSSYGKEPFRFRPGKGKVIAGWEGLALGMREGSKLIARIPAQYAYGDKGVGPIPPGATLVFYMECLKLGNIRGDKPRLPEF